jgi:hypothetical protein
MRRSPTFSQSLSMPVPGIGVAARHSTAWYAWAVRMRSSECGFTRSSDSSSPSI